MLTKKISISQLPGTFLMWLILLNEVLVFSGFILAAAWYRYRETAEFVSSTKDLDHSSAITATLLLLAGGYFAAEFVQNSKKIRSTWAISSLVLAIFSAVLFLIHKWNDLHRLASLGLDFEKNDFWLFYWGIMGFHFAHVIVAVGFLIYTLVVYILSKSTSEDTHRFYESSILFWHICDVIWVMIFPLYFWRS